MKLLKEVLQGNSSKSTEFKGYKPKSPDEAKFVNKHVIKKTEYPNCPDQDAHFQATNVKTYDRSERHGYNPGEDEKVYEAKNPFDSKPSDKDPARGSNPLAKKSKVGDLVSNIKATFSKNPFDKKPPKRNPMDGGNPLAKENRPSKLSKLATKVSHKIRGTKPNPFDPPFNEETQLNEVSPPGAKAESWIKANKKRFYDEYGPEKGKKILYAKAWEMFGDKK